ncbi:MAG: hypothetical protein LBB56_07975 [Chitinispirillales bacterium]|jgi:hypothetical protein|nr:hypothetical protein [Chitinispirillales bacterium]
MKKSFYIFILFTLFAAAPYGQELSSDETTPNAAPKLPAVKESETMIGLGAGMSIGSVPLFTLWQSSLPDSMRHIGLTPDFGIDNSSGDSMSLRYAVTETPEQFNIILPLTVSVYNIKNDRTAALGVSFFYTGKQFQSAIYPEPDTLNRRVNIYEKLNFYSLSLEAGYQKAIPPQYFSISGSQQTFFSVSLAASPFNMFTRSSKIKTSVPVSDERMLAAADSARKHFSHLSSNGKALSWRLGFTTLKRYGDGGAFEMGLFYGGSYNALFYNDGSRTAKSQIYSNENEKDKNLAFLQSRIELRITLLRSLKQKNRADSSDNDINGGAQ